MSEKNIKFYSSVSEFQARHGVLLNKKRAWRLAERVQGEIHGIPGSRGWLAITDGVECYIERGDGSLFIGHIANFVKDEDDELNAAIEGAAKKREKKKSELEQRLFDEY